MISIKPLLGAGFACALLCGAVPARATDTIETGLVGSPNSAEWEMYVGIHQGFFADAGIKLDIIYVPTASGVMQQLSSGSLDLVDTSAPGPIDAVAHGAAVAIIRITQAVPPYDMVADSKVKTIKDLKGKTVVLGSLVNITHVYLERVLKAAGLKDSDVDLISIGNTAGRFAALKSGTADAAMLAPPINFIAESSGFHNIGSIMEFAKDLPFGAADVSLAYASKHHDVVVRFLGALNKSIIWFNTDANRAAAIDILAGEMKSGKRDEIAESYDYLRKIGFFPNDSTAHRKPLEALMDAMTAIGDTEGKVPLDKLLLPGVTKVAD
jgi:ABC-type nitrate/sulfonate/bicarbonate transport system substrate-binding protein